MWRIPKYILAFFIGFSCSWFFWTVDRRELVEVARPTAVPSLLSPRSKSKSRETKSSVPANSVKDIRRLASLAGSRCISDSEEIIRLLVASDVAPEACLQALVRIDEKPEVLYGYFREYLQPQGLSDREFIDAFIDQRPDGSLALLSSDIEGLLNGEARDRLVEQSLVRHPDSLKQLSDKEMLSSSTIIKSLGRSKRLARAVLSANNISTITADVRAAAVTRIIQDSTVAELTLFPFEDYPQARILFWEAKAQKELDSFDGSQSLEAVLLSVKDAPDEIKSGLVEKWLALNPGDVIEWLHNTPSEDIKTSLVAKTLREAAMVSLETAATASTLLESVDVLNDSETTEAFVFYVDELGKVDPAFAFRWVENMSDPLLQERAYSTLITTVLRQDPYAVAEYIADLDPSPIRDSAIQRLVVEIPDDPERVLQWGSQIEDPSIRLRTIEEAARKWAVWDPLGTLSVLETIPLPSEELKRLIRSIHSVQ